MRDVTKSYGERRLLDAVTLTVRPGERVGIVGDNGAGKTTLLRVLAGALAPDAGHVTRHGRIGYLAQEIPVDHPRRTLLATFADGKPEEDHVDALSAGQRRRLALARLLTGTARPAALVAVSHDRALRRRFTGAELALAGGRLVA